MTISILVDEKTLQVFGHFEEFYFNAFGQQSVPNPAYKNRLSRFIEILEEYDLKFGNISNQSLRDVSCLVILTRIRDYSTIELEAIKDFLQNPKNSLLVMSNHNPFELQDNVLTSILGASLVGGYWSGERGEYTYIDQDCLTDHPIITGREGEKSVTNVVTNTTCRIESEVGTPFIYLPDSMIGRWSSENEAPISRRVFGLAFDGQKEHHEIIKGRMVILGDSGFLGDKDSTFPGFGVMDKGDNELFVRRLFEYLLK